MGRILFVFALLTFILVGVADGRPKRRNKSMPKKGFDKVKKRLEIALSKNSAPTLLTVLKSLPNLKPMCQTKGNPLVLPITKEPKTQDFGWLFDLVKTALKQNTQKDMFKVLMSEPKLRRQICRRRGRTTPSTNITPSTPAQPKPTTSQSSAITATKPVSTPPGVATFVDVALRGESLSSSNFQASEDFDEFVSIPAMRKRRSSEANDSEDTNVPKEQKRQTRQDDHEQEFHISTVVPTTILPAQDSQPLQRTIISSSDTMEDGQFEESIVIYPESESDDERSMDYKMQQTKENEMSQDHETSKLSLSNTETLDEQTKSESKVMKSSSEDQEDKDDTIQNSVPGKPKKDVSLGKTLRQNDVMASEKEFFLADETPEKLFPAEDDKENKEVNGTDELSMPKDKRNLKLLSKLSDEVEELKLEDSEKRKSTSVGGEIKYEVDADNADDKESTKRKVKKIDLNKLLKKKNILHRDD